MLQQKMRVFIALSVLVVGVVVVWCVQGIAGGDTKYEKALNDRLQQNDTSQTNADATKYRNETSGNLPTNDANRNRYSTTNSGTNTTTTTPDVANSSRYDAHQNTGSYQNASTEQKEKYVYWEHPDKNKVMNMTSLWPQASQKAIADMLYEYGNPDIVTNESVIWRNKGSFLRITVLRNGVPHSFPKEHTDVLEQVIAYKVPVEKIDDLARFDGSIIVDRTAGTITARCNSEAANFAALNLAHEIIANTTTVNLAQQELTHIAHTDFAITSNRQINGYTSGLEFTPFMLADTRDPGYSAQFAQSSTR